MPQHNTPFFLRRHSLKKIGSAFLLCCLLNPAGPAFAQADLVLAQKVKNLEAAMVEKDHQIADMKKLIMDLSQSMESLREAALQAAADQTTPLVTEPAETRFASTKVPEKGKFARRRIEDEKIREAIAEENKKGVVVGVSGTGVLQQIIDSKNSTDTSFGEGSLHLIFASHPISHTTFFAVLKGVGGQGPDQTVRSNAGLNADGGSLQDTDGVDRIALAKAWLGGDYFNEHLEAVAGKIDLGDYFDANAVSNDETRQFLSNAFVNNPTLENPGSAPGAILYYDTQKSLRIGAGIQHSLNSGFAVLDHPYFISEIDYTTHFFRGLEGNYRLLGHMNGANAGGNKGFGISMDQILFPTVTAFARYGLNRLQGASHKYAWSTGFEKTRFFPSRPSDALGFAFGQQEGTSVKVDSLTEIYYRFFLSDHLSMSPHLQWLIRSSRPDLAASAGSLEHEKNVFVIGLRSQVDF